MNVDRKVTGGCLCGDTKYTGNGEPKWVVHCHCKLCQRHSGAAFLTYVGFSYADLSWEEQPPAIYKMSDGVERGYCGNCGSTMTFGRPSLNEISVFAGTLDYPDQITPTAHAFWDHHFSWLDIKDDNPRYARHPAGNEDREA